MNFIMLVAVGLVSGFCTYRLLTWASRPKIVRFKDGTYGVRRFSWFFMGYLYINLASQAFWWGRGDEYFPECRGTEERARAVLNTLTDKGEVAK